MSEDELAERRRLRKLRRECEHMARGMETGLAVLGGGWIEITWPSGNKLKRQGWDAVHRTFRLYGYKIVH